jgi:chromosome segregation ATPase
MQTHLSRRTSRVLVAAAIVVLALSVSACGSGKKSTSTTTDAAATEQWASSVCSAFTTWKTSLEDIKSNLTAGLPSSSDLRQAGRQFEDATQTLTKSLEKLGPPDTAGGQAAKNAVSTLENNLSQSMTTIENTLKSSDSSVAGVIAAIPTLKTELTKMKDDLTQAANQLKEADPGGELEHAFRQAPACSAYVKFVRS